ncbi:MAG: hypothetical protein R3F11_05760 [Verrucomicrobiales bacterium]
MDLTDIFSKFHATRHVAAAAIWLLALGAAGAGEPFRDGFDEAAVGEEPDGLFVVSGTPVAAEVAGNKVLEVKAEPLEETGALAGPTVKGAGAVEARFWAEKKRRSSPRFGVGMHGTSGYRLRVVPARKKLEVVKGDEVVAEADFDWKAGAWCHLRFEIASGGEGKVALKGYAWAEGSEAPEKPTVSAEAEGEPATGKASVWATPYAGLPIYIDDISVRQG